MLIDIRHQSLDSLHHVGTETSRSPPSLRRSLSVTWHWQSMHWRNHASNVYGWNYKVTIRMFLVENTKARFFSMTWSTTNTWKIYAIYKQMESVYPFMLMNWYENHVSISIIRYAQFCVNLWSWHDNTTKCLATKCLVCFLGIRSWAKVCRIWFASYDQTALAKQRFKSETRKWQSGVLSVVDKPYFLYCRALFRERNFLFAQQDYKHIHCRKH